VIVTHIPNRSSEQEKYDGNEGHCKSQNESIIFEEITYPSEPYPRILSFAPLSSRRLQGAYFLLAVFPISKVYDSQVLKILLHKSAEKQQKAYIFC
jgi:hypothetical protein